MILYQEKTHLFVKKYAPFYENINLIISSKKSMPELERSQ